MTHPSLPTIRMFWHGPFSRLERLSVASFLGNGHPVDLYVYEEPAGVPNGVELRDASTVLPKSALFRHKRTNSLALFADWFRYRLLYERGGIWADADVICLRPFNYEDAVVYAWLDEELINNAVLGLPPRHPLAQWMMECCENPNRILQYDGLQMRFRKLRRRLLMGNRRENVRWGENGPRGLTRAAKHLGYVQSALPSWHFYPVAPQNWNSLFRPPTNGKRIDFGSSRAVHFWNNYVERSPGFDKNATFPDGSPIEEFFLRYLRSDG
jgi:hypothetical protein